MSKKININFEYAPHSAKAEDKQIRAFRAEHDKDDSHPPPESQRFTSSLNYVVKKCLAGILNLLNSMNYFFEDKLKRAEAQKKRYHMKRYGNLDRLNPNFVKPKQVRKPRAEVEIEFYHLPAIQEEDFYIPVNPEI